MRSVRLHIAVLCVAAQLVGLAHLLLVRHQRCAEHGEVEHAGEAHGAPALDSAREDREHARITSAPADVDDHDHCQGLSEHRTLALGPAIRAAAPVSRDPPATPPGRLTAEAGRRYRLAPKTSPPAV